MKNTILTTLDHIHCHIMHLFNYIYKNIIPLYLYLLILMSINIFDKYLST